MNPHLTPTQIDEIFDAAEYVDVPVTQLLDAAAEIRAALLGASGEISLLADDATATDVARAARADRLRRVRVVRTALVAAALAVATLLGTALAGALPAPLEGPIAHVAKLVGIDLPRADAAAPAGTSGSSKVTTNSQQTTSTDPTSATSDDGDTAVTSAGTDDAVSAEGVGQGPVDAQGNAYAYGFGKDPGVPATPNPPGQVDNPGNAFGQDPGIPGNGNAYGIGNGNGPPEDPGNGNGNAFGHDT